ncbi:MAG: hypothetical protein HFG10_10495 [Oscillibacter sp.]|jgi:hypothetical protein|nr:hypothetical protein [Oscillibacter sp.]
MNDQKLREALVGRGITLNTLRDQQFSLNRQMLLALQLGDEKAQERIQAQLAEIQTEIDRITLRQ